MILIWLCLVFLEIMCDVCVATILCSGQKGAFYWLLFSFNRAEAFS